MAYYGIIRDIVQDDASIRVEWELINDPATSGTGYSFTFDVPVRATRAEFRDDLIEHALGVIRPIVEKADTAAQHIAAVKAQIVGRRWPSP